MWQALAGKQPRTFIVALAPPTKPVWVAAKRELMATAHADIALEQSWDELPLMQVHATSLEAATELVERDEVAAAYDVEQFELTDAESFPLIDQPAAAAAGDIGAGTSVAILDTGTKYTLPDFGSCTAPGVPAATCKVAYAQDFAADDGSLDDNGHGTNVAGITVGVAPGAKILALDVFTGESAYNTDIISAINWSIANQATYHIAAMNLSLGGGLSTTPCSADPLGIALAGARSAGIAPVVASGNGGSSNSLSSPGCAPAAISVGAVYDSNINGIQYASCTDATTAADKITCFSNSASFLTLLAPGALITAAGITMAGTSQATPHVAGAIAVLRAAHPTETVDQLVKRLTSTGKPIKDARNSITVPRIDVFAAVNAATPDATAPTGSVTINGGATTTKAASVTLAITATDNASGVATMCVTTTTACTTFATYTPTKTFSLAATNGRQTVTVFLRDVAGNTSTVATSPTASIVLDTVAPTNGTLTATPGNSENTLEWTGFADATSGIATYKVVGAASATAPACTATALYTGTAASFTHASIANGTTYSYRVCAIDVAGNISTGAIASAAPRPEFNPPTGTLTIPELTKTAAIAVTLAATDDTKVATMCLSEAATCTAYIAYAATTTFKLAAGDGAHTVHAWFRDTWGNTSAATSASTKLDTTAPTAVTLNATPASSAIVMSWTTAADVTSGMAGYRLVGAAGTTPPAASCGAGTMLYTGTSTTFTHVVAAKATWSYRLCALDNVGNISVGTTKTATAAQ